MLIALVAPAGSGKTTAAKHLARRYGFKRIHAGQPIKDGVRRGFGLKRGAVEKRKGKEAPHILLGGASPRAVLEAYGEGIHQAAPLATAILLKRRLTKALSKGKHVVIDGVRGEPEAEVVRRAGGKLVGLDNGSGPNPALPLDQRQAEIVVDHMLRSKGGKKELREAIDALMRKLMGASLTGTGPAVL